jgi:hypothetical protein
VGLVEGVDPQDLDRLCTRIKTPQNPHRAIFVSSKLVMSVELVPSRVEGNQEISTRVMEDYSGESLDWFLLRVGISR